MKKLSNLLLLLPLVGLCSCETGGTVSARKGDMEISVTLPAKTGKGVAPVGE